MRFREIDIVRVKGKQQPIAIYELMTGESESPEAFGQALQLYRKREFDQALAFFSSLSDNDPPSRLYAERCREFLAAPPPLEWDGVFTARSK
jgi:adenylate cyclase